MEKDDEDIYRDEIRKFSNIFREARSGTVPWIIDTRESRDRVSAGKPRFTSGTIPFYRSVINSFRPTYRQDEKNFHFLSFLGKSDESSCTCITQQKIV